MKIEQSIKEVLLHEVDEHFQKAQDNFLKKDMRLAAAEEILKGSSLMKKEVVCATEEGKKILDKSIHELEMLAHDLGKCVVTSEEKVKNIFESANSSIVKHKQLKVLNPITKKN